jgi:hypothetical protein
VLGLQVLERLKVKLLLPVMHAGSQHLQQCSAAAHTTHISTCKAGECWTQLYCCTVMRLLHNAYNAYVLGAIAAAVQWASQCYNRVSKGY